MPGDQEQLDVRVGQAIKVHTPQPLVKEIKVVIGFPLALATHTVIYTDQG